MARKRKRKNKNYGISGLSIWIIVLFIVLTAGGIISSLHKEPNTGKAGRFENIKQYKPVIKKALAKYDLEKYTTAILALMQQESRGKGGDPMQASESAGLPPDTIEDPKKSIRQGVKHFHNVLKYGKQKGVDFPTILQSYNMGIGYINYVAEHGGEHSKELAKEFSLIHVHENPELYDCGGDQDNFRYPYCYGDFTYSSKVLHYIETLKTIARSNSAETYYP